MIPKIYPYKLGSKSAKALAQALNCKRVRPDGRYRPKSNHLIINWGNSQWPSWAYYDGMSGETDNWLNPPHPVAIASNKRETFRRFVGDGQPEAYFDLETGSDIPTVPCPSFTTITEVAQEWIDEGHTVYGRKTLTGHSGSGIILFNPEIVAEITPAYICPLYTKSTKAKHEFRIHVGDSGETVIDQVQKKRKTGFEGGRQGIRSHADGWVFARQGISVPNCVLEAAKGAVKALSLDFGAVDVGYNHREDKAYVYEVNTAPAMEGQTLTSYVEYFQRKLECTQTLNN